MWELAGDVQAVYASLNECSKLQQSSSSVRSEFDRRARCARRCTAGGDEVKVARTANARHSNTGKYCYDPQDDAAESASSFRRFAPSSSPSFSSCRSSRSACRFSPATTSFAPSSPSAATSPTFGFVAAGARAAFFFFATTTPGKLFFFPAAPVFFGTGGARGLDVGAAGVEVDVAAVVEASEGERDGEREAAMAGGVGAVERFVTAL